MFDIITAREERTLDEARLDVDLPLDDPTPHADDFDINDLQKWIDLSPETVFPSLTR